MKKTILILSTILVGMSLMVSCGSDDDTPEVKTPIRDLKLTENQLSILLEETKEVKITDGNGGYIVKSSDDNVAKAILKENVISVEGKNEGNVTLTVTDAKSKTATIEVKVSAKELSVKETEITLNKNETKEVEIISGYGNYTTTSSDENVATVKVENNKIVITGVKKGNTIITITDTKTKKKTTINVEVTIADLDISEIDSDIILVEQEEKNIQIKAGSGSYEIVSNENSNVATVELNGTEIKIKGLEGETLTSKSTVITVRDKESGKEKKFTVKVFKKLSIGKKVMTITEGGYDTTPIVSGNLEGITFEISNPEVATAEKSKGVYGGNEIKVTAKKAGTTVITVKDGKGTEEVNVTVNKAPDLEIVDVMGMSGQVVYDNGIVNMVVNPNDNATGMVMIKGSGQYEITGNNTTILSIGEVQDLYSDNQSSFDIGAVSEGEVTITITDKVTQQSKKLTFKITKI